jgi:hypothetical protein
MSILDADLSLDDRIARLEAERDQERATRATVPMRLVEPSDFSKKLAAEQAQVRQRRALADLRVVENETRDRLREVGFRRVDDAQAPADPVAAVGWWRQFGEMAATYRRSLAELAQRRSDLRLSPSVCRHCGHSIDPEVELAPLVANVAHLESVITKLGGKKK